ncbi:hypothetical protein [Zooshikella ganghwensis]|uniref:Uncharacterized protein n=1 Tax=Zooshikella ganghwensis TaxID=202772 RepID=A0A4P9VRH4_9GAMM|nr:hypothetical protein [Zooshikella ganghwensis]RDH41786.1 hypothetical protein B9G39_26525 [Zooshikella ganghwensis]RDH43680.1 hypothetical protein B9G39_09645 [Zooshikella ganghwensis]RDH46195.1 hypothetical protein B9G39_23605 [Zooshikella ganghwensis]
MEADSPTDIPLTLEDVKAKFEAWRQRPKPRKPFPHALWHDVFRLQEQYKLTKILTTLRLSRAQLIHKRAVLLGEPDCLAEKAPPKPSPSRASVATDFISVDLTSTTGVVNHQDNKPSVSPMVFGIELTRPDGTVLKIHQLPTSAVDALIHYFIA